MKKCVLPFALLLVINGCSSSEEDLPGYTNHSGDLGGSIIASATRLGARPRTTNGLPEINASWHSKEDDLRTQIFISGNYFPQLHQFLTNAFGPLPQGLLTNNAAGKQSLTGSYGTNVGADLNFTWEKAPDGKEYTTVMISRLSKPAKSP
jgi:hypothetical protein